jgi:hypothetical protein
MALFISEWTVYLWNCEVQAVSENKISKEMGGHSEEQEA